MLEKSGILAIANRGLGSTRHQIVYLNLSGGQITLDHDNYVATPRIGHLG